MMSKPETLVLRVIVEEARRRLADDPYRPVLEAGRLARALDEIKEQFAVERDRFLN